MSAGVNGTLQGKRRMGAYVVVVLCLIYMANPSFGVLELLPDNISLVGNIDEGLAMWLLFHSLKKLGFSYLLGGQA